MELGSSSFGNKSEFWLSVFLAKVEGLGEGEVVGGIQTCQQVAEEAKIKT